MTLNVTHEALALLQKKDSWNFGEMARMSDLPQKAF